MEILDYILVLLGVLWFYFHHVKKLSGHMSFRGVMLYSTLKASVMLVIPFVSLLLANNILEVSESSVWALVAGTFLTVFALITITEDKKIGVIDEEIEKARNDFYK